jgi:hypothetical protein
MRLGMIQKLKVKNELLALKLAPWAVFLVQVEGGFMAFLTADDYAVWKEKLFTQYQ